MGREPVRQPVAIIEQGVDQGIAIARSPVGLYVIVHGNLASVGQGSG